ncbi:MAG: carboxypeptidase-like regulatory domain-containing protein, partial [Acidobacteriota bacterium]|nr:carboxypeptidase-like regulatory domain-containing protein [Acidobacteriota bacterium]
MSQRILRLAISFALLSVVTFAVAAQESRGSLTGRVTDSTGAAITNAQVIISSAATGVTTTVTSNNEGNYTALYLLPGQYRVTVEAQGFKKLVREGIEIRIGDKAGLDLQLEPGAVNDTITITGDSTPLLDSASATSGQVIDRRRIAELPLGEGNPLTLVRLAPTTVLTGGFTSLSALSSSGPANFAVDGNPQGGNEFTLDGSPNTADRGGQAGALRVGMQPPVDAVAEFKVTTTSFDAQQGHTAGASIDVSVRSGTSQFHGTLYE